MRTTLLGLCLLLIPALAVGQTMHDVAVPAALPSPSGPYRVGRQPFEVVDSSRSDPADSAHARAVAGWIWYPADRVTSTAALERALPGEWSDLRAAASAIKIGDRGCCRPTSACPVGRMTTRTCADTLDDDEALVRANHRRA